MPTIRSRAPRSARQRREVELERIGLVQHEAFLMRESLDEGGGKIPIDLDHIERAARLKEQLRERAASRTDLNQVARRTRRERLHDAADDRRIVQEMLSKALPCPHGRCVAH